MRFFVTVLLLLVGCGIPDSGWAKCSDYTGQVVYEGRYTDLTRYSSGDLVSIRETSTGNMYYLYNTCCVFTERPIVQGN